VRRAALLGGVAAVLVGCGGRTKTVTVTRPPPSTAAALTAATRATAVSKSVEAIAEKSVVPVLCDNPLPGLTSSTENGFTGTGFKVTHGVVTASHVVAACSTGATSFHIGPGDASGSVSMRDPTHDLALLTYQSFEASPHPLHAESVPPYVGEPLALIGIPVTHAFIPGFQGYATVARGIVLATRATQQLTSADGQRETLTDAIRVAGPGILPGESGGPAIDAAGKVVGVIEGSGSGVATLTPVADLTSLC
jgi:S1-C subfamily serine protease